MSHIFKNWKAQNKFKDSINPEKLQVEYLFRFKNIEFEADEFYNTIV